MRYFNADDEADRKEVENLRVEPWMLDALAMNPSYCSWGPHEDYMATRDQGWSSPLFFDTWADMEIELDDLVEVVNFYFEISREARPCESCDGGGYNAETKQISDDWYDFAGTGHEWHDKLTQDEVDALVAEGRLKAGATADEINTSNYSHDAINRWICVEARARRLGVWGTCPHCKGEGHLFTEDRARFGLVLWLLHPRKGCSRGVEIKRVEQSDLPAVFSFLHAAAERNAQRFARVCRAAGVAP